MSWIKINSEKDLPPEGKYVIAKHNRGTWHDSSDQENVNTVVVKLEKGLSEKDRQLMKDGKLPDPIVGWSEGIGDYKRSDYYESSDEFGNNSINYSWDTFGTDSFFGQSITHWMPIPKCKN